MHECTTTHHHHQLITTGGHAGDTLISVICTCGHLVRSILVSQVRLLAVRPVPPFTVVSVHAGTSLLVWDTPDRRADPPVTQNIGNSEITSMTWSRDGRVLFTADRGGICKRFRASHRVHFGEPQMTVFEEEHRWRTGGRVVVAMAVSETHVFLATGDLATGDYSM